MSVDRGPRIVYVLSRVMCTVQRCLNAQTYDSLQDATQNNIDGWISLG